MTERTGRRHTPAARTAESRGAGGVETARAREAQLVVVARTEDDPTALSTLVEEHLPLVERIARAAAPHPEQVEDLVQEGAVGLLKAIHRYEPERGVPFEAYARTVVLGEIRHHLRDRASLLRLPEPVRELRSRLRVLSEAAQAELGRMPTIAELAEVAGVSDEEAVEAVTAAVVLLDDEHPAGEQELESSDERVVLGSGLAGLDPREQHVVVLRFFLDLTQAEIAQRLGISQMQVSRLLRGAIGTMRATLEP